MGGVALSQPLRGGIRSGREAEAGDAFLGVQRNRIRVRVPASPDSGSCVSGFGFLRLRIRVPASPVDYFLG